MPSCAVTQPTPEDIFIAHIAGMDAFARALIVAREILESSDYQRLREERYSSFDDGRGAAFARGELSLEQLRNLAIDNGEPEQRSGKQELFEQIVSRHL